MSNRAGLRKVVKTVRTKKGVVRRSYWVRAGHQTKAAGMSALAITSLIASPFVGAALGQRIGAAAGEKRAGQIFNAGLSGRTADSINEGASGAYRHMQTTGAIGGVAGALGGGVLGSMVASRLVIAGQRRGLFTGNTIWARRIGASAGFLGGAVLSYHAHQIGQNNRAERFRNRFNETLRQAKEQHGSGE